MLDVLTLQRPILITSSRVVLVRYSDLSYKEKEAILELALASRPVFPTYVRWRRQKEYPKDYPVINIQYERPGEPVAPGRDQARNFQFKATAAWGPETYRQKIARLEENLAVAPVWKLYWDYESSDDEEYEVIVDLTWGPKPTSTTLIPYARLVPVAPPAPTMSDLENSSSDENEDSNQSLVEVLSGGFGSFEDKKFTKAAPKVLGLGLEEPFPAMRAQEGQEPSFVEPLPVPKGATAAGQGTEVTAVRPLAKGTSVSSHSTGSADTLPLSGGPARPGGGILKSPLVQKTGNKRVRMEEPNSLAVIVQDTGMKGAVAQLAGTIEKKGRRREREIRRARRCARRANRAKVQGMGPGEKGEVSDANEGESSGDDMPKLLGEGFSADDPLNVSLDTHAGLGAPAAMNIVEEPPRPAAVLRLPSMAVDEQVVRLLDTPEFPRTASTAAALDGSGLVDDLVVPPGPVPVSTITGTVTAVKDLAIQGGLPRGGRPGPLGRFGTVRIVEYGIGFAPGEYLAFLTVSQNLWNLGRIFRFSGSEPWYMAFLRQHSLASRQDPPGADVTYLQAFLGEHGDSGAWVAGRLKQATEASAYVLNVVRQDHGEHTTVFVYCTFLSTKNQSPVRVLVSGLPYLEMWYGFQNAHHVQTRQQAIRDYILDFFLTGTHGLLPRNLLGVTANGGGGDFGVFRHLGIDTSMPDQCGTGTYSVSIPISSSNLGVSALLNHYRTVSRTT